MTARKKITAVPKPDKFSLHSATFVADTTENLKQRMDELRDATTELRADLDEFVFAEIGGRESDAGEKTREESHHFYVQAAKLLHMIEMNAWAATGCAKDLEMHLEVQKEKSA